MSLHEPWGHCIDDWATIQKSPTALIINLDPGYVLRSILLSKWISVQEGNFLGCFQALGALSGDVDWVTAGFWGVWSPFFIIPSFMFKLAFCAVLLRYFRQSLTRWSGWPHAKQFWFFFWYSLTTLAKWMMYSSNWSAPSTPTEVSGSPPSEDLTSSAFFAWVFDNSIAFHCSWSGSEGMTALQLPEGNKFPDVWEWVLFNPPVGVVFKSRGSLASVHFPISGPLRAGWSIWQDVHHPHHGPTITGIQGPGPHRSNPTSSPLCTSVGSFLDTLTGVSGPAATIHSKFSHIFSHSLLEGIKLLARSVQCHYHTAMLIQGVEDLI